MKHLLLSIRRIAGVSILLSVVVLLPAFAQVGQVEVTRNVNLRADPSTGQDSLELLHPPDVLTLLSTTKTQGYYHVRTTQGKEGWIWARNVQLSTTEAAVQPTTTVPPTGMGNSVLASWAKGTPKKTTFNGDEGPCGFAGDGGDPVQYTLKNRADAPKPNQIHDVTWDAISGLDYPGKNGGTFAKPHRKDWKASDLAAITPVEGVALRVVGFLAAIKPQTGNEEGTNCGQSEAGDVDFHLALVKNSGDEEKTSIVIEFTPRFLKDHPNWTKAKMTPWLNSNDPIRVTGWLMYDPNHKAHLGKYRSTLWEIHPITKFEVFQNGQFVDLDDLP